MKRERQMTKEQDLDLTEQVDADLDEIRGLLAPMNAIVPETEGKMVVSSDRQRLIAGEIERPSEAPVVKKVEEDDDYDRFVKELAFDRRAKATDRIKSEEEIALNARQELEELEAARIKRMNGDEEEEVVPKKRKRETGRDRDRGQADDLADDFDGQEARSDMPLTYKDGILVNDEIFMKPKKRSINLFRKVSI